MADTKRIFNIGEEVWIASHGRQEFHDPCPVCFGKLAVHVILGNGDTVLTPCSYCGSGIEEPRGWTTEYRIEPAAEQIKITGREIREGESMEVTYYHASYCYRQEIVFETKEEALIESIKLCEKEIKDQETRAAHIKKNKIKSFAWNAGYHLREAKRLGDQIAYHERMATICRQRGDKNVGK